MKAAPGSVAGAGGAPTKVAGASGGSAGKVAGDSGPGKDATGGGADAAKGAKIIGGGGGDLASALEGLTTAIKALGEAIAKMAGASGGGGKGGCGAGNVAGVRGGAATKAQFVAKSDSIVPARSGSSEDDAFEARVHDLVNKERAKAGLAPVSYNATVDNAAEKHAVHMSKVGKMAHDGIGDGDPGERIRAEGWRKGWGENVATGQTSPEQVVREWMNSPTHRRNILDPNFRHMGVAQTTAQNGRSYWAQEFGA